MAAIEESYSVMDASGTPRPFRGRRVAGVLAQSPFIPEIGEKEEAAWGGAGDASAIGLLKALALRLGGVAAFASGKAPVIAAFAGAGLRSAPFAPIAGRPFNVTAWGDFEGSFRLVRSFDAGVNWHPITAVGITLYAWTVPVSESVEESEVGVTYALECTAFTSGPINYRISQ